MGISYAIKKGLFNSGLEGKLMTTINIPIFIKDFNKENENISSLNKFLNNFTDPQMKMKIENELRYQKCIQKRLAKVYFILKNSPVPFYGLHNIRLEYGDNKSNIDFLIITNQFCCIINCRNQNGNIEIDSQGRFSRLIKKSEKNLKEGIHSPVEENSRAELILKSILNNQRLEKLPVMSLTVFINSKTTLNFKSCPKDIKDKVIKINLLNSKIKELVKDTAAAVHEETKAKEVAEILKDLDISLSADHRVSLKVGLVVKLFQNWTQN